MVPGISIKDYIIGCKKSIKNCYDHIDTNLVTILGIDISKQEGRETIFQKGYLLYDLVHDNTMDEFIELLKNTRKIYNTVVNEPQLQSGDAPSTLLQVIGLTKIKAIIEFMNSANATNLDISNVTNANALSDMEDVIDAIAKFFYEQPLIIQ